MSDTEEEQTNLDPPSTVAEETSEATSEVPFLSEDNPELQIFNDVLISMCEAFQFILLKCALITYDESKIALETSFDGGPSRITPEQKSKLQSVVDISIRNYITLYHLTSAFENIFRLFKRGITSNFATLFVFLTLFCSVVSGIGSACPKYTEPDIISGKLNFFDILKTYDSCKIANTVTVQEKIYIDKTDGPSKPPVTADETTILAYNYAKERFEATNTYQNLKDTRRLESLLHTRAMQFLLSSNNMFERLNTVVVHKYEQASKIYVNKTLNDPLDPERKETLLVPVFSAMTPTQAQIEEVKNKRLQQRIAQGKSYGKSYSKSYDEPVIKPNTTTSIADKQVSDDNYLVFKTFQELFHLDFAASCKFVEEGLNSYNLCSYTLSGPSVDFDSPLLLLNTLAQECLDGIKTLGVTGLEGQNTQGKFFLKLMSVHSKDDRILQLGDFYTTIQRIIDIPIKLKYLVTDSTKFKQLAKTMFSNVLDKESFEQIMTDTSVPGILDEGIGLSKNTKFESIVHKIKTDRMSVQEINDAIRDPLFLKSWLHEAGLMFNDIMTELPMTENARIFLNNTLTTAFQVANHLVLTTGNVSMTGIDQGAHFARIGFHIGAKSAEAADRFSTTVYNTGNDMLEIFAEEATDFERSFLQQGKDFILNYQKTVVLFFVGLLMCYAGGPEKFVRSGWGAVNAFQEGKNEYQRLREASESNPRRREIDNVAANQPSANPRLTIGYDSPQPIANPGNQGAPRIERVEIPYDQAKAMIEGKGAGKRNNFYTSSVFNNPQETGILSIAKTANELKQIQKGSIVVGTGRNLTRYDGPFYTGGSGTRKHKKRIGAASKHHKKRRRGTKKPSKKRRATRRKRR
jgi:hypothetical protein